MIANIDGLGPKAVSSVNTFFSNEINFNLVKQLGNIIKIKKFELASTKSFFSNKSLVFTGTLEKLSREEAKYKARINGAKILSSVSKNTDYLIIGENSGSKAKKAKELGIEILNENEFLKKINS